MDLPSYIRSLHPDDVEAAIARAAELFDAQPGAVKSWLYGERYPRPATGKLIVERTKGRVTFAGIYGAQRRVEG